jgi:hypothetical protein
MCNCGRNAGGAPNPFAAAAARAAATRATYAAPAGTPFANRAVPVASVGSKPIMNIFKPRWKRGGDGGGNGGSGSVDPNVWGPGLWRVLHTASVVATGADLVSLPGVLADSLPCSVCTMHYRAWLAGHPVSLSTDFVQWFVDLHNNVNIRNGKAGWSVDSVRTTYGDRGVALAVLESVAGYLNGSAVALLRQILASG